MTGSTTYHQPYHLNEHDELQLVAYSEYMYMAQCAQSVSNEQRPYIYLKHDGTVPTCFNQSKASISFDYMA